MQVIVRVTSAVWLSRVLSVVHSQIKMKVGFIDMDGAIVEVDYTSQENKDIQKRRKHLFRVEFENKTEFMFQAPSDAQRKNW